MGALIPIGEGADAEIKDLLNKTFAGFNLKAMQAAYGTEKLFKGKHTLHRVAYRLRCNPHSKYAEPSRAKWFYLLKHVLTAANFNGKNTAATIQEVLDYAQNPANNVKRVVFDAVEDGNAAAHYIDPDNLSATVISAIQRRTIRLMLVCPAALDPTQLEADPVGPDLDNNGNSVETNSPLP